MKQIVKNYSFYPGDFRRNEQSVDIIAQINHDLKKNPTWSIKLMTYTDQGLTCTVVYDIAESSGRRLVEDLKELIDTEEDTKVTSEASAKGI